MPITAECGGCGKRLRVKDELVGKRIKCPGCGAGFTASASSAVAPAAAVVGQSRAAPKKGGEAVPRFHVSPGILALVVIGGFFLITTSLYYAFPKAVADDWERRRPDAAEEVEDVIQFLVKADASKEDWKGGLIEPNVHSVTFLFGPMHWSMPEEIGFIAVTGGGKTTGVYHPDTHEISLDIEEGGMTTLTGVLVKEGKRIIHGTGRRKDGIVSGEIDGKKVVIRAPTSQEWKEYSERRHR
jgi:hypothetical protein